MSQDSSQILIQTLISNVATLVGKIDALVGELNRVAQAVARLEERMNAADSRAEDQDVCPDPGACLRIERSLTALDERLKPLERHYIEEAGADRQRDRSQRWFILGLSTAAGLVGAVIGATVPTLLQYALKS